MNSFVFTFTPTRKVLDAGHLGRQFGGWGPRLRVSDYDPATGVTPLEHAGGIFIPGSRSGVTFELGMTLLQFGHPNAVVAHGDPRLQDVALVSVATDQL